MPVDERFTVRTWGPGDEKAILELFARSFPHAPRSEAHFRWKYLQDPLGASHISLAFDEQSRLVGHYAGYPVPFYAFGREIVAHQIGDTMTDPAIRHVGRGPTSILGRTALHFYSTFCESRVAFNYGFNVANIQKFSLRFLRSDRVETVSYRVRDLRTAPFPPPGRIERWSSGYRLELVQKPDGDWDDLFLRVARHYRFLVRRDAEYVRWRYAEAPEGDYLLATVRKWGRLVGWLVYRIREGRFEWGDALFDPTFPDAVGIALRHLAAPHPLEQIVGWFPPRPHWFHRILTELGFTLTDEPQGLSLMCVPFTWPDVVARMREELYYTWGDGDLF